MASPSGAVAAAQRSTGRNVLGSAALLLGLLLIAALMRIPVWGAPETTLGGTGGDPTQMLWFLEWTPFAIGHGMNPFWTHYMNAQPGTDLLWNTAVPAAAVVLWPITAIWNVVVSYNVLVTLSFGVGAWTAYIAVHRYVASRWACTLGGLIYGFSPLMSAQSLGHAQVLASAIALPVLLILVDQALIRQRLRWWLCGVLLAAVAVFQFFIFEEYFVTAIMASVILAVVLAIVGRHRLRAHLGFAARTMGLAALLIILALAVPVAVQLHDQQFPAGAIHDPDGFVSDPLNFILPTAVMWLAPNRILPITQHFVGNLSEQDAYLGIPLCVLLLVTLVRCWHCLVVRVAGVMGIVIAILSLGPHLHFDGHKSSIPLPWWPIAHIPAVENIIPSRLTMYVYLAAGIVFAFALERLWQWRQHVLPPLLVAAAVIVLLVPKLPLGDETVATPAFFTGSGVAAIPQGETVYAIPFPAPRAQAAMLGQVATEFRFKIIGGYFLGEPAPDQTALLTVANELSTGSSSLDRTDEEAMLTELRANRVQLVMLTAVPDETAVAHYLDSLFGPPLARGADVMLWIATRGPAT